MRIVVRGVSAGRVGRVRHPRTANPRGVVAAKRDAGSGKPPEAQRRSAEPEGKLRDRVAELEQQVAALRFAADQGDLVREQFADLYDYAPVGYLTVDEAGVIRRVNVPAAALLGGSRQELSNRKLATLVRPADKARFSAFLKAAFTVTSPVSVEVGLVHGKWRAERLQFVAAPAAAGRDLGHPGAQARLAVLDITDRWKAEEALRQSRDRFQAVVAAMAEGVVVHDATGAIRECNTAAQRILGLSEDELLGRTSVDPRWRAIHEDGTPFPGDRHPAMEVLRTGASRWNVPMGVQRPDGTVAWLRVSADPLRNGDGSVHGVVVTFADVTEDRRRADERAEILERLSLVIDGSDDGFWDWNVETGHVKYSRRLTRMFGYDLDELEPSTAAWDRIVHPDDREPAWAALRRHLDGEVDRHVFEARVRHKDGHWVHAVVRGKVVAREAAGKPLRIAGTITDVTERAEMRQALEASEKRYRDLVEGMTDGLIVVQDGEIVFSSPAAVRLSGVASPADLGARTAARILRPDSAAAVEEASRRVLAGEAVSPLDTTLVTPDGRERIVEAAPTLVSFDGRPAIQVVLRDVTERRALQARLVAASRLEAVGALVAGMAHEVDDPRAGTAGAGVAAERGKVRLRLRAVVDEAVRRWDSAQSARAELRLEDAGAPDVMGVESQVVQVVVSLLANASQAIPADRRGVVTVRLAPGAPGMARIEVEDDGVGLGPDAFARSLDPLDTTRGVGHGSTFRLELPVAPPEA